MVVEQAIVPVTCGMMDAQPVSVLILAMPPGAMTRNVSIMIRTFRPTRE